MRRQHRGETRRLRIVRYLRENPGARQADIARAVGLALSKSNSPQLVTHLEVLLADGYVRRVGQRWEAAV